MKLAQAQQLSEKIKAACETVNILTNEAHLAGMSVQLYLPAEVTAPKVAAIVKVDPTKLEL